jgi:HD-like signal output (HDOD) protein
MQIDLEIVDREAEQIVKEIGIPPCPMILTKLMQEMRGDDPDFGKIARMIRGDVSLAATMLKTVNSPFYGLRSKATSVTHAIALLGLRHVAELVAGLLLRQAFPGGTSDVMDEFWENSSGIAQINELLLRHFKHVKRDGLQTFGLFRDCGVLAMMQKFRHYEPVFPGARRGSYATATAVEDAHYRINHARVGYQMARTWLLPDGVCRAVLRHHDYAELHATGGGVPAAGLQHIAVTLVAESIFVKRELGVTSAEWVLGSAFALEQMAITQPELDDIAVTITAELAALQQ